MTLVIFSVIALDPKNAEGWGMALGPVVGLGGLVALFCGIVRGFWCRHHRPLLLLALSPIVVVIGGFIGDTTGNITLVVWAVAMIVVPLWWFAKGKRHYQDSLSVLERTRPTSSMGETPEIRR